MNPSSPKDPVILTTADVLDELASDIEFIGAGLCADTQIAGRHAVRLQGIDLLAQTARHLAEVLRSECATTAVSNVRLASLQERLGGAVKGRICDQTRSKTL